MLDFHPKNGRPFTHVRTRYYILCAVSVQGEGFLTVWSRVYHWFPVTVTRCRASLEATVTGTCPRFGERTGVLSRSPGLDTCRVNNFLILVYEQVFTSYLNKKLLLHSTWREMLSPHGSFSPKPPPTLLYGYDRSSTQIDITDCCFFVLPLICLVHVFFRATTVSS